MRIAAWRPKPAGDFEKILKAVENASVKEKQVGLKMKTFEESAKSQKTIASLIENPTANNNTKASSSVASKPENEPMDFKENIEPVSLLKKFSDDFMCCLSPVESRAATVKVGRLFCLPCPSQVSKVADTVNLAVP